MHNPIFNPFPGLRSFESDESHLFFGRDGQSDELIKRLRRTRFLAIVGTSGSGKSSLMRAGMLPALQGGFMAQTSALWHIALMRPGAEPVGNLAQALSRIDLFKGQAELAEFQISILRAGLCRNSLGLIETCKQASLPNNENLLVVVDQFEELFRFKQETQTAGHSDEASAFVQLLIEAACQQEVPIYIVLTMRSDYLGDCAQFQDLPEAINDGQYLIPRMTREQRRAAITGPIAVEQGKITPRLVNRLLNDMGDNPDQLPILQHALMRTWDYWQAHRQDGEPIDLPHYEEIGGMLEALSKHADEAYNELPDERSRKIAEIVFKRLTEKGADNREIRRPTRLVELREVAEAEPQELIAVIERFRLQGRSFLMPPAGQELLDETLIDISHESLIRNWKRLKDWVEKETESAKIYLRLAETAHLHQQGKAALWHDPDLIEALHWQKTQQQNAPWACRYHTSYAEALTFLAASCNARDAEILDQERQREEREHLLKERAKLIEKEAKQQSKTLRQTRMFLAFISLALLFTLIIGGYAVSQRKRATENEAAAKRNAERFERLSSLLRLESLQRKRQIIDDNSSRIPMAYKFLLSPIPKEQAIGFEIIAQSYTQLGAHKQAIRDFGLALQIDSSNVTALDGRRYNYTANFQWEEAEKDNKTLVKLRLDPQSEYFFNALNLTRLGNYDAARTEIHKSIDEYVYYNNGGRYQSKIAPDIQKATGRTTLAVNDQANLICLYYELATIEALAGRKEAFFEALKNAAMKKHSVDSVETALFALNLAWSHEQQKSNDYGVKVIQGALWKEAGFPDWALYYYEQFIDTHEKDRNPKYASLYSWVKSETKRLAQSGKPVVFIDPDKDAQSLYLEAMRHRVIVDLESSRGFNKDTDSLLSIAAERINKAIQIDSTNLEILLEKVAINFVQKDYEQVVGDCESIIKGFPKTAPAYLYRAQANLNLHVDTTEVENDLLQALMLDSLDGEVLFVLAQITEKKSLEKALRYIQRATQASISFLLLPDCYYTMARLQRELGFYEDARKSIELATSMGYQNGPYYHEAATIYNKLADKNYYGPEFTVSNETLRLYEAAIQAYLSEMTVLVANTNENNKSNVRGELNKIEKQISSIFEKLNSNAFLNKDGLQEYKTSVETNIRSLRDAYGLL